MKENIQIRNIHNMIIYTVLHTHKHLYLYKAIWWLKFLSAFKIYLSNEVSSSIFKISISQQIYLKLNITRSLFPYKYSQYQVSVSNVNTMSAKFVWLFFYLNFCLLHISCVTITFNLQQSCPSWNQSLCWVWIVLTAEESHGRRDSNL